VPTDADRASIEDFLERYEKVSTDLGVSLDPDFEKLKKLYDPESDAFDKVLPLYKKRLADGIALKAGESSFRFAYIKYESDSGNEFVHVVLCLTKRNTVYEFNNPATPADDVVLSDEPYKSQIYWILQRDKATWLVNDSGLLREGTSCETNPFV
jgi:hypothetical protein